MSKWAEESWRTSVSETLASALAIVELVPVPYRAETFEKHNTYRCINDIDPALVEIDLQVL